MNDEKIQRRLDRIDAKITALYDLFANKVNKPQWVRSDVIRDLTGWNSDEMEKARRNNYIKFKKDGNRYWYDPSTIPATFLKKSA